MIIIWIVYNLIDRYKRLMKVRTSKYVSREAALENLNPSKLLSNLQKLKIIPESSKEISSKL